MAHTHRSFIPAAGHDLLLPLYDPINKLTGEERVRRPLVEQAAIEPGHRVLDVGCGTGGLTLLVKRMHPDADVTGLDPDPKALALARRKAARAGLEIRVEEGFGDELPFGDGWFDRVFSSMMLHHLDAEQKAAVLREVRRVLAPGGSLHLLDFGPPRSRTSRVLTWLIHRGEMMRVNLEGRIPDVMREAGFAEAADVGFTSTVFGTLSYYRAG